MTGQGGQTQKYAGFMSYAHDDEDMAGRLHKALETYKLPKAFRTLEGHPLKPIFRDVAELSAHHSLSDKIQDAVKGSRFMIVLCSPAAKNSHWVNVEIRYFRELHGDDNILSVMASGTPETAFPEALTEGGREPLAADISGDKAGFRLGVTQIAAAMLGTGLDDLVQRDEKRRTRRFQTAIVASLAFSGVMAAATLTAVDAKKEAEVSRNDAEGLVEYMITDLKDKLEPVGRLDILDGVGERAVAYYDRQDIKDLPDESLTRQARARHVLGQVALDAKHMQDAKRQIEAATRLTEEVLARNPHDTEVIFAHAQSEFWVGKIAFDSDDMQKAREHWQYYRDMTAQLHAIDKANFDWIIEAASGENNLGSIDIMERNHVDALGRFEKSLELFNLAHVIFPKNKRVSRSMANVFAGAARASLYVESAETSLSFRQKQIEIYEQLTQDKRADYWLMHKLLKAKREVINVYMSDKSLPSKALLFEMRELSSHDPLNIRWKETYFHQLLSELNKLYFTAQYEDFMALKKEYDTALGSYRKLEPSLSEYELFMGSVIDIHTQRISGNEEVAKNTLETLNKKFYSKNSDKTFGLQVDIVLTCMNDAFGQSKPAEYFAGKYLQYEWVKSDINSPTILQRKILAFNISSNVEKAAKLVDLLKSRGFYIKDKYQGCYL